MISLLFMLCTIHNNGNPVNGPPAFPNPDERDKCLSQIIFGQKNKKIICKSLKMLWGCWYDYFLPVGLR